LFKFAEDLWRRFRLSERLRAEVPLFCTNRQRSRLITQFFQYQVCIFTFVPGVGEVFLLGENLIVPVFCMTIFNGCRVGTLSTDGIAREGVVRLDNVCPLKADLLDISKQRSSINDPYYQPDVTADVFDVTADVFDVTVNAFVQRTEYV